MPNSERMSMMQMFLKLSPKHAKILSETRDGAQAVYTGDREFGRRLSLYRLKF